VNENIHTRAHDENEPIDEIEEYWKGRYLSTREAMWRILGFNITKKEPSVTAVSVQLPTERPVQRYKQNNTPYTLSSLNHYFVRPLGSFFHDGVLCQFNGLTFVEYFTLF
jgi:hypothetical protein